VVDGVLKAPFSLNDRPEDNIIYFSMRSGSAFNSTPGIVLVLLSHTFSRVGIRGISDSSLLKKTVHLERMILAH